MDTPTPNEHHQKLTSKAGTWKGTEHMHPSPWLPEGGDASSTATMRADLGGFVVVIDYEQQMGGQTTYQGHGVYTVDPQNHDVVLHWFDSMGGQHEEFRGRWEGQVLTLQSKNPMGHMRLTYDYSQDGVLKNHADMSPDGKTWNRMFDGHLTRG